MIRTSVQCSLAVASLLALACDDGATEPCARPHACEIEGVDLVVVRAYLIDPSGTDAVTGHDVVDPGEVVVEYVVRNRGSQDSPPREAWVDGRPYSIGFVSDSIPPLAPGDSVVARMRVPVPAFYLTGSDLVTFITAVESAGDADESSNHSAFDAHVALPVIEASIDSVSAAAIRVGEPFAVTYRVRNVSTRSTAAGLTLRLCLRFDYSTCWPGYWGTFGHVDVPNLPPGGQFSLGTSVRLPSTATIHDEDHLLILAVCPALTSWTDPYLDYADRTLQCFGEQYIRVLPDYEEVCSAPLLESGETHFFTDYNCGRVPATAQIPIGGSWHDQWSLFHVIGIDAAAGRPYRLERSDSTGGLKMLDPDGADALLESAPAGSFAFGQSGRYYLVMHTDSPAVSITLR